MKGITNKALLLALISIPAVAAEFGPDNFEGPRLADGSTEVVESGCQNFVGPQNIVGPRDAAVPVAGCQNLDIVGPRDAAVPVAGCQNLGELPYLEQARHRPYTVAGVAAGTLVGAYATYKLGMPALRLAGRTLGKVASATDYALSRIPGYESALSYVGRTTYAQRAKEDSAVKAKAAHQLMVKEANARPTQKDAFAYVVYNTVEALKKDEAVGQIRFDDKTLEGFMVDAANLATTKEAIKGINLYSIALNQNGSLTERAKSNLDELYAWVYAAVYPAGVDKA